MKVGRTGWKNSGEATAGGRQGAVWGWMVRTVHWGWELRGGRGESAQPRALLWLVSDQESGLRLPGSGLFLLRLPLVIGRCPPPTSCSLFQGEAREWSGEACGSEVRLWCGSDSYTYKLLVVPFPQRYNGNDDITSRVLRGVPETNSHTTRGAVPGT